MSDSALDSILDQYSEDAKKTQKITHLNLKRQNEKSNTKNPQLPTQDELKHKSKPAQSFNNDINQKDTQHHYSKQILVYLTMMIVDNLTLLTQKIHVNLSNQLLKMHIALVKITIFMRLS